MLLKKQIGVPVFAPNSPILTNTSVKLCVKFPDVYSSLSCIDTEKVLSFGLKDMIKDLIASNGFCIKCLNFSIVLTFRRNACEHSAICEIKSFLSSISIFLKNFLFYSEIDSNLLIRTVFPTPRNPLKITD